MNPEIITSAIRPAATDAVRDAWLAASDEATAAYDAWCAADTGGRREAYAMYRAAADREDAAAKAFAAGTDDAARGALAAAA
jgi:hypothetical protein